MERHTVAGDTSFQSDSAAYRVLVNYVAASLNVCHDDPNVRSTCQMRFISGDFADPGKYGKFYLAFLKPITKLRSSAAERVILLVDTITTW